MRNTLCSIIISVRLKAERKHHHFYLVGAWYSLPSRTEAQGALVPLTVVSTAHRAGAEDVLSYDFCFGLSSILASDRVSLMRLCSEEGGSSDVRYIPLESYKQLARLQALQGDC